MTQVLDVGFTIDGAESARFAQASGDRNPLHVDPLAARRTPYGRALLHGVHVVLRCLDRWCERGEPPPRGLRMEFPQPCFAGESLSMHASECSDGVGIEVRAAGAPVARIGLLSSPPALEPLAAMDAPERSFAATAVPLAIEELEGRSGRLRHEPGALGEMFPAAALALGPALSGLAALTALAGMECPGRDALLSSITVAFSREPGRSVEYRVQRVHASVRQAMIRARAPGVEALLRVGVRPPPVAQPPYGAARALVAPGDFQGRTALVIGGSRGLGEVAAKLLAAGGARTLVTYVSGREDGERVAAEIRAGGGLCEARRHDATAPAAAQLADLGLSRLSVYYFPTGPIARRPSARFDSALFAEFCRLYVDGFADLISALQGAGAVTAFYPSTIFVERPDPRFAEYAAAKAAGESVAHHLDAHAPGVRVLIERLDRLATDQTASIVPVRSGDALRSLLPVVQRVEAVHGSGSAGRP